MAKNTLSDKNLDKFITDALAIEEEAAQDAGTLGFMARALTQATLPHSKKEGMEYTRVNGDYTLTIIAPSKVGLPYGSIPRLLLSWVATEAVRTQEPTLYMGGNLAEFMRKLDLQRTGGAKGDITRLRDQTMRLFSSIISCSHTSEDKKRFANYGFQIACKTILWWDDPNPGECVREISQVTLTQEFFKEVTTNPVPVDMRALMALKQSPMALDIYTWLTYRMSYLKRPTIIPWEALQMQFGSDYGLTRSFKHAFIGHLRAVCTVYPEARVEVLDQGLKLIPSPPHVARLEKPDLT